MEIISENAVSLCNGCRVCARHDNYMNLFYNINKELLKNLKILVQSEVFISNIILLCYQYYT